MTSPCVHRWRIETPAGPEVKGECVHCGMRRTYPSTSGEMTASDWVLKSGHRDQFRYPRPTGR